MRVITENPIDEFIEKSKNSEGIDEIYILSPFISEPSVQKIIELANEVGATLNIVTNLNPIQLYLSLSDPAEPLLKLLKEAESVRLKKCNQLHAKVYLVPNFACLFGSSNLTIGGMKTNFELNLFLEFADLDRELMGDIQKFIDDIWKKKSQTVTKKELKEIKKQWADNKKKYLSLLGPSIPEPALAGDYFGKLKTILKKKTWKYSEIDALLSEKEDTKNTSQKLLFLMNLGVVSAYDEQKVLINKEQSKRFLDPHILFSLLKEHLFKPEEILAFIGKEKKTTYYAIEKKFRINQNNYEYRTTIHWLCSLGLATWEKKAKVYISITKKGLSLLNS